MFLVGIGGPIKNTGTVGTAHPFRIARPAFSQHFIVTEGTTFSQAPTRHLCVLLVSEVLIVCLLGQSECLLRSIVTSPLQAAEMNRKKALAHQERRRAWLNESTDEVGNGAGAGAGNSFL